MADLYNTLVYRHATTPSNKGKLTHPTKIFPGQNVSCGDEVRFYVKLNSKNIITDVRWEGSGCAISQAASSILSNMIKGKTLKQAQAMKTAVLLKKLAVDLSPSRVKCAVLPLYTIKGINFE
ncbi:MAG: iron-sulfur cluster assembly scaffold protein [Patescibacteria group bacterium]|jgi:nitrogen fixation NifU-like protein